MGHHVRCLSSAEKVIRFGMSVFVVCYFSMIHAAVRSKLQTTRIGSFSIKSGGKLVSYQPPTKSTAWKGLRLVLVPKIFWNLANM